MKNILLYQHQSSLNHGCEALVYTISEQIKQALPNSKLSVSSFYSADDALFSFPNVDCFVQNDMWLRRFTFPWLVYQLDKRIFHNQQLQEAFLYCKPCYELAKSADVCVAIGGDNYCYNKGKEHWPLERKIKKLGKKMMLWGCSVEPSDIHGELAEHLSLFDVITVRDPISYEALISSNVKSQVLRCSDPAFLLPSEPCALPDGWKAGHMIGLNFSPMVMGTIARKDSIRLAVQRLIEHILDTTDHRIVLIPHVFLPFTNDLDELRPLYEAYRTSGRVIMIDDHQLNARQLKYIISQCRMFIGARTHATIAAYSTHVPTLAIGYSVKARGIAQDLFGSSGSMVIPVQELSGSDVLIEAYQELNSRLDEIRLHLEQVMPDYQQQALASGAAFKTLLG